ncbi:NLR family CARD domain-containing protein 3-like isoform X2 [Mugil cephalus]|uniref:NLR family CARD domain-containing protein 3-like isoform X2 n=1 Tax=Mugil cephalus TaxID=48193 RepID=UPI001FB77A1B|nr:NLR family CARD domain-containing protein 3-like isoform X2 [Mugil cephalus]
MSRSKEKDKRVLPPNHSLSQRQTKPKRYPGDTSCVSMKSDGSMDPPLVFKRIVSDIGDTSGVSMKSDGSMDPPLVFKRDQEKSSEEVYTGHQTALSSMFVILEENILTFVKNELKELQRFLDPECFKSHDDESQAINGKEEEQMKSSRKAFLKIALQFMRRMKQEELADFLQNRTLGASCHHKLKLSLKKRFQCVFEGIAKAGNPARLNQVYTELFITDGGTSEVNCEHEVRQIEKEFRKPDRSEITIRCQDIFKGPPGRDVPIRTVMTKGVAGIGKTVLTKKFTLDWAEDKANQDIQFLFPFSFRELNVLKERKFSLVKLVHHFFPEIKEAGICKFEKFQVVLIFDGLDECRLPLDFHNNEILTDVTESTSVDVLLTNIIRGKLLPSAHLWITTRPAAANQIPPECVDMATEIRGFTDPQKDEYFRKRFRDEEEASRIVSHIKRSQSLHIMCHIPVFCWITATVLENVLKTREGGALPKTLSEMYIHYLVVQTKMKKVKYDGGSETDPHWSPESRMMIESLGKLAFDQLQKGNMIFYESDLTECGIDIRAASVYSGVFTQIFQEERGLYQDKVFCFIHLSVQEFLAALHVHLTFVNTGVNLLSEEPSASLLDTSDPFSFYQNAVDKALQSPNGHLDLFLRFLLGFSLPTNHTLLGDLLKHRKTNSSTTEQTVEYIKSKCCEMSSSDKNINLLHCLMELEDTSLIEHIQKLIRTGELSTDTFCPAQWSSLAFILLAADENLDMFDLKKYSASDEALVGLLPVIKASTKAVLSCCNLSERSCKVLASVLSSYSCTLKELDLSNNDLQDSGVELLCEGLQSPHCSLETLRLSGCLITKRGCASLNSALSSNFCHLKELDLRYNHPEDLGVRQLSARLEDQNCRLASLRKDHRGSQFMQPGLKKYACELTLDPNTAHRNLVLSDHNRKVTAGKRKQSYPDHPERFDFWKQLLCTDGLTGRRYWEVEWTGQVYVGVTYRGIKRKGADNDSCIGRNDQSWSLKFSDDECYGLYNDNRIFIPKRPSNSERIGVYLDWRAGTLSFFIVSSDKLIHLHTFYTTFTEAVYPAFRIRTEPLNSSVSLLPLSHRKHQVDTQVDLP